jgi:uncharacterized protein YneF (UPF0154 family)
VNWLNSWVILILIIVAIPIIIFYLTTATSRKIRKDIKDNPYDHRNNPPPPGGMF